MMMAASEAKHALITQAFSELSERNRARVAQQWFDKLQGRAMALAEAGEEMAIEEWRIWVGELGALGGNRPDPISLRERFWAWLCP